MERATEQVWEKKWRWVHTILLHVFAFVFSHLICKICMFIVERKTLHKYSQLLCRKGSSPLCWVCIPWAFFSSCSETSEAFLPWQHVWLWGGLLPAFSPMLAYNTSSLYSATSASNLLGISALISEALGLWAGILTTLQGQQHAGLCPERTFAYSSVGASLSCCPGAKQHWVIPWLSFLNGSHLWVCDCMYVLIMSLETFQIESHTPTHKQASHKLLGKDFSSLNAQISDKAGCKHCTLHSSKMMLFLFPTVSESLF